MKRTYYMLIAVLLVLSSCGPKEAAAPTDVAGMKALVKEKKAMISDLQKEIDDLNSEIEVLEPKKEKDPTLVTVEVMEPKLFEKYTTVQGNVMSDDVVLISSETGGRLVQLNAQEGDYVKKGQLLGRVDMTTVKNQIAEVQTQLDLARTVYQRQKRLWDQNIGSEIQYLQAESNVKSLEKSIATLQTQLSKANIYAPMSGYVDKELVKSGEVVGPGSPIFQILNTHQVKVVADVPESFLGSIKKGDKVAINFPALDKEITKRVSMLGRTIDPSNRTFKVEVNTSNPGGIYKPNLLAEMKFKNFTSNDAISVPLNIVLEDVNGDSYVFLAKTVDGKLIAERAFVEIDKSEDGRVIVTEGLKSGDKVIVEGARNVSAGDPLIISNQ